MNNLLETSFKDRETEALDLINKGYRIDDLAIKFDLTLDQVKSLITKNAPVLSKEDAIIENPRELLKKKLMELIIGSDIAFAEFKIDPNLDNQANMTAFITKSMELLERLNDTFDTQGTATAIVMEIVQPMIKESIQAFNDEMNEIKTQLEPHLPDSMKDSVDELKQDGVKSLGLRLKGTYDNSLIKLEKMLDANLEEYFADKSKHRKGKRK